MHATAAAAAYLPPSIVKQQSQQFKVRLLAANWTKILVSVVIAYKFNNTYVYKISHLNAISSGLNLA